MTGRRVARILWCLFGLTALTLAVKFFVTDAYRISSGSMRPTLFGGRARPDEEPFSEWVLVRYDRAPAVERWDLVVHVRGDEPVVKRVAGLPGESVQLIDGDLFVDGALLPHDAPRPAPIPVFDDALLEVDDYFEWKRAEGDQPQPETWRRSQRVWALDATRVPDGSNGGMMFYRPELRDDYLDEHGRRVVGKRTVGDAILELEFALDAGPGRLRFQLVEKGDTFEARLTPVDAQDQDPGEPGTHTLELVRTSPSTGGEARTLASTRVDLGRLRFQRLRFSNVDDTLRVQLPDQGVDLVHAYERNERHPLAGSTGDQSVGWRAGFGGEGVRARFRSIRILRDLHYTTSDRAGFGVERPLRIGPDEVFLLGDNSRVSDDSRHYGPVGLDQIVGRPVFVVWPWSRVRRLEGAAPATR